MPYTLSTNEPSFFYSDHLTGACYWKFDTNGTYVMIAKEHMGVWPLDGGKWIQTSNGVITMTSTNQTAVSQEHDSVVAMTYRKRVFLVWPEKDYKADVQKVCRLIDSGTNAFLVYNEFLIPAEEFAQGTSKPYGFKFYREMNKVTGAEQ
ncbi:MAG TPA: hypothetical protein PKM73_11735 [Verrucomicrobiota bacterium]|nr:hypothetical protein [Verrucomicrobiota bacterium]